MRRGEIQRSGISKGVGRRRGGGGEMVFFYEKNIDVQEKAKPMARRIRNKLYRPTFLRALIPPTALLAQFFFPRLARSTVDWSPLESTENAPGSAGPATKRVRELGSDPAKIFDRIRFSTLRKARYFRGGFGGR